MWKGTTVILASLLLLTSGCVQNPASPVQNSQNPANPVQNADFEIKIFTWTGCSEVDRSTPCNSVPIGVSDDGQLSGRGILRVESKRQQLTYAKIFVNGQEESFSKSSGAWYLTWKYENALYLIFPLQSLSGEITLEVCASAEEGFTRSSPGVVCKTSSFAMPAISVAVSPDPATFTCSADRRYETVTRGVTVTNTGEIPMEVYLDLPDNLALANNKEPVYTLQGVPSAVLMPGGSTVFSLSSNPVYVRSPGTYSASAYITSLKYDRSTAAKFKKPFTLVTQVV